MDEGHCGLPKDELVPLAEKLLEVPQQLIQTALELELKDGTVVADQVGETPCVFLAGLYRAERTIAGRLTRLANGTLPWPWIDPDKALPWVGKRIGLALAESQVAAIQLALKAKTLVMTGGPGVGKTTIVNAILSILAAKGTSLLLCAPTGRAAKRMTEATGFEAKTIHRLLEVDPRTGGFKRGEDNPLDCDLLVIDETSMVDVMLMQSLLRAVPDKAALLIVGDIDQLPSVGPGQGEVPVVRLTGNCSFSALRRASFITGPIGGNRLCLSSCTAACTCHQQSEAAPRVPTLCRRSPDRVPGSRRCR
jgi:exodeoxyribonuclease V alpha subunit